MEVNVMRLVSAIIATLILATLFSPANPATQRNAEEKISADSVLAELKSGNGLHVAYRYQEAWNTARDICTSP
jgi:hypothetical protein